MLQLDEIDPQETIDSGFYYQGVDLNNYLREGHDLLAERWLLLRQSGTREDASGRSSYLQVRYYDFRSPALARRAAAELQRSVTLDAGTQAQALSVPGADSALLLHGQSEELAVFHFDTMQGLILRCGTQVVCLWYYGAVPLETVAEACVQRLTAGA